MQRTGRFTVGETIGFDDISSELPSLSSTATDGSFAVENLATSGQGGNRYALSRIKIACRRKLYAVQIPFGIRGEHGTHVCRVPMRKKEKAWLDYLPSEVLERIVHLSRTAEWVALRKVSPFSADLGQPSVLAACTEAPSLQVSRLLRDVVDRQIKRIKPSYMDGLLVNGRASDLFVGFEAIQCLDVGGSYIGSQPLWTDVLLPSVVAALPNLVDLRGWRPPDIQLNPQVQHPSHIATDCASEQPGLMSCTRAVADLTERSRLVSRSTEIDSAGAAWRFEGGRRSQHHFTLQLPPASPPRHKQE